MRTSQPDRPWQTARRIVTQVLVVAVVGGGVSYIAYQLIFASPVGIQVDSAVLVLDFRWPAADVAIENPSGPVRLTDHHDIRNHIEWSTVELGDGLVIFSGSHEKAATTAKQVARRFDLTLEQRSNRFEGSPLYFQD